MYVIFVIIIVLNDPIEFLLLDLFKRGAKEGVQKLHFFAVKSFLNASFYDFIFFFNVK